MAGSVKISYPKRRQQPGFSVLHWYPMIERVENSEVRLVCSRVESSWKDSVADFSIQENF